MAVLAPLPSSLDPNSTPKTENKFYAFFRSRSRSRSRTRANTSTSSCTPESMTSNIESIPTTEPHSLHTRRPSLAKERTPSENPPSSYSPMKSSVRSQSRPISSTTTATHSTIAPLPSDSLRRRTNETRHDRAPQTESVDTHQSNEDYYQPGSGYERDIDEQHLPRSETPTSTRRKLAFHTLFGIALTRRSSSSSTRQGSSTTHSERKASSSTLVTEVKSGTSRKRSFRMGSRPTTPKSSDDPTGSKSSHSIPIPSSPLPLSASPRRRSFGLSSQRSTPKSSTGHLPLPTAHNNRSHGGRQSVSSQRTPHDSAVALPESENNSATDLGASMLKNDKAHPELMRLGSKGKEKGSEKRRLVTRFGSRTTLRPAADFISQSLPADTSPISQIRLSVDRSGMERSRLHVPPLPTVESLSSDEVEGRSSLLGPRPKPIIPQIIHTPPTPQRTADVDIPSRPTTSPPRVDAGKVKIAPCRAETSAPHREQVLVSSVTSYAHSSATSKSPTEVTFQHNFPTRGRFTPWLFGGRDPLKAKDTTASKVKARGGDTGLPDMHGRQVQTTSTVSSARNIMNYRAKHGSFDFERPVSALNRGNSTINRSKNLLLTLERSTSTDSTRVAGKSRTMAHDQVREDSSTTSQLRLNYTGTSVASLSSASVQSKTTSKGAGPNVVAGQSSSWGRASGKRIQRTSHGTFAFEHPASVPSSPMPLPFNLPSSSAVQSNDRDNTEHTLGSSNMQTNVNSRTVFDLRSKHNRGNSHSQEYVDTKISKHERKSKGKGRSLDLGLGLSWAPSRVREEAVIPGLSLARERGKRYGSDVTKTFEVILSPSGFEAFKKYVHRFDAHAIPLEGPSGLLTCVDKLLANSGVSDRERNDLMNEFTLFVEGHGG